MAKPDHYVKLELTIGQNDGSPGHVLKLCSPGSNCPPDHVFVLLCDKSFLIPIKELRDACDTMQSWLDSRKPPPPKVFYPATKQPPPEFS